MRSSCFLVFRLAKYQCINPMKAKKAIWSQKISLT